ncbi:EpsG family protein [Hyunsoonleella sp. SJ7]|uniref:EpsG family protein n=1 Tax=Hyunsoonleella aquatilis TaxID=2762758 RepID=A0A923HBV9_9FLAO|nr:EpsG family protein [Hyunsoonleella aquatilis]MBC3758489.1 EpsG family protein [Hyunsoonleella aquatilis]
MVLAYIIYIFLFALLFAASAHNIKLVKEPVHNLEVGDKLNKYWRWPLIFAFTILVLIIGLRYDVGVDFMGYRNDYLGIVEWAHHRWLRIERYEFGYEAIVRTLLYFNIKAWVLFTIIAIFTWYFFIQSFKIFPHLLKWGFFFAFTTGFFFASNNGMRQTIALVIFMYAIKFIEEKSLLKFTLYIILASSFHSSIFLVYPFYFFINRVSFTGPKWLILFTISYFVGNKIDIRDLIIFGLELYPKYQHYTDRFLEDFSDPTSGGIGNFYIFILGFLIILLSGDLIKKMPKMKIYYNLFFIGAILFNFFWKYSILGRITYLFIWFKIFCLAAIAYHFAKSRNMWIAYFIIITQLVMFFYKIFKSENQCAPFQFVFALS